MVIFTTFFVGNIGHVNVFYDILERKNACLGYKNKNFKISTNVIFRKWLTLGFGLKMAVLSKFFLFGQYRPGQSLLRYSRTKNAFQGYKKNMFKKSKKLTFFKGANPWFWSNNGHFSNFFFFVNIGQKNVFYDILERKNVFLGYKNKKFKQSKIVIFPKGLTHGFGPIMAIFQTFSFLSI